MTDRLEFHVWVFWRPFWTGILDFRLQTFEWRITQHVHHWTNIGPYYRPTALQAKRKYLFTLQVSGYCLLHLKSRIVQYLFTLKVSRNCLLPFKSIVIQKILGKSGKTCWVASKSHSTISDYSGNMVSKFHVDSNWINTQGKIASNKTCTE